MPIFLAALVAESLFSSRHFFKSSALKVWLNCANGSMNIFFLYHCV